MLEQFVKTDTKHFVVW